MKKAKLTLDKLTVASLTAAEEKKIVGGESAAATNITVNTSCVNWTRAPTTYLAGCPVTPVTQGSCRTIPTQSCAP